MILPVWVPKEKYTPTSSAIIIMIIIITMNNLYLAWPLKPALMIAAIGAKQFSILGYRVAS